jgi:acetyl esterase
MKTRMVTEPRFAAETTALLARLGAASLAGAASPAGAASSISGYQALLAARAEPADPALAGQPDPAVHIADLYLPARHGPVGARWYRHQSAATPGPVLLWLHGGGFIGGAAADLDHVCSRLAHRAGLTVVSLDYRLAPEHPYPAALLDTCDTLAWLADHSAAIGGDGRIAAGGQSAGAALVAGACLLARDRHQPGPASQVLCYPVLDYGQDTESARMFNGVFHSIKPGWKHDCYLAGQPVTAYAAPLRASSLAGLPPALVIGAGRDPLRDDARAYAARLDADGVNVTHVEYDATMHAFLNFCGVLSAGDHAIELIGAALADTFASSGQAAAPA